MKSLLLGAGAALLTAALGFGARQAYINAEVQGCLKFSIASIESVLGQMPEEVKKQVTPALEAQCRQTL